MNFSLFSTQFLVFVGTMNFCFNFTLIHIVDVSSFFTGNYNFRVLDFLKIEWMMKR